MNISTIKKRILLPAGQTHLSGVYGEPSSSPSALIVALPGGTLTARIFDDTIPGEASFIDTAAALGNAVLALDRPGYGESQKIAGEQTTFDGQIAILRLALSEAWQQYGGDSAGIMLTGHSFGGLIALGLAASNPNVPLLGVSTHGTGLAWQPGALQRYQSRLSGAPFVVPVFNEHSPSYGPAWSWAKEASSNLQQCLAPMPMTELRDVLCFPERLRQIALHVRVPVQMTLAEFDSVWETSKEALEELSQIFPSAPFVDIRCQRFVGHQLNANFAARAFYLRELAFVEECRVQKIVTRTGQWGNS
jgi:pimeloyl-ACP methyl ester carboxylesterase